MQQVLTHYSAHRRWLSYLLSHRKHSSEEKTVLFTPQNFPFPSASSLLTPPSQPHPCNVTYTHRVRVTNHPVHLFPELLPWVAESSTVLRTNGTEPTEGAHYMALDCIKFYGWKAKDYPDQWVSGKNMEMLKCFLCILKSRKEKEKVGKSCILRKMFPLFCGKRNRFSPLLFQQ